MKNISETAKFLNVSRQTLTKWIKSGKIKPTVVKQSGLPLFSEEDLINLTCKKPTLTEIGYKLDLILRLLEQPIQQDEQKSQS